MAKIPFDIKYRPQIESGEYNVETRDGWMFWAEMAMYLATYIILFIMV